MSKYSYEFKKKVVMDYINGKGGYKSGSILNVGVRKEPTK